MFILILNLIKSAINTRSRIIDAAISLFNKEGFMNVSMQRLANELELSPGNLTYHFPKKQDLMLALYDHFQSQILEVIPEPSKNLPTLIGIDDQITSFYQLQQRFLFFYLDLLEIERSYQEIAQRHFKHIQNQIEAIHNSLEHNWSLGYLRKNKSSNSLHHLAQQLWFTAVFWPKQCRVRGVEDRLDDLRDSLWSQITPHLTKEGEAFLEAARSTAQELS